MISLIHGIEKKQSKWIKTNRSIDIENKVTVAKGAGGGGIRKIKNKIKK